MPFSSYTLFHSVNYCRHRKSTLSGHKHDADRYCAYNLLIFLGPVAD
jgi:hypothetical protein